MPPKKRRTAPMHSTLLARLRDHGPLLAGLAAFALFFSLATVFYSQYENWSVTDSVFFVIVTLSTVGYGQPAPTDDNSRLFTIFVIIIGVFVIIVSISDLVHSNIDLLRNWLCKRTDLAGAQELDLDCGDVYHYRRQLFYSIIVLAVWVIIGAAVMKVNEDWTWTEAFYFIAETSSTVGYGDLYIKEASSKAFLCVYILFSSIVVASAIKTYSATVKENARLRQLEDRLAKLQSLDFLVGQASSRNLSKHEIVLSVLLSLGKIDHARDVAPLLRKIAADDDTPLTQQQVEDYVKRQRESAQTQQWTVDHLKRSTRPKLIVRLLYDWLFSARAPERLTMSDGGEMQVLSSARSPSSRGAETLAKGPGDDVESPLQRVSASDEDL